MRHNPECDIIPNCDTIPNKCGPVPNIYGTLPNPCSPLPTVTHTAHCQDKQMTQPNLPIIRITVPLHEMKACMRPII